MSSVTFEHVSKLFGDVTGVNDMSLEIHDNEFLVLLGHLALATAPRCECWPVCWLHLSSGRI
jgi:hypothetical protein